MAKKKQQRVAQPAKSIRDGPPDFLTPSPMAWMDQIQVSLECPVCHRSSDITLRKPADGAERFGRQDCACGHAYITVGWVFGDYVFDFTIKSSGMDAMSR